MDNLKYYNESLAYDFNMFMPRQTAPKDNIVSMPESPKLRVAKRKAATRRLSVTASVIMVAIFVMSALCGNIMLRLKTNEVSSKINKIKSEINAIDSQITDLEVEFERRISYSNIELEAAEIGMQKMDKEQVHYIRVNEENSAVLRDGSRVQ